MGSTTAVARTYADGKYISFLHLPAEIRYQIYHCVLESNPRLERVPPGYPTPQVKRYVTTPIKTKQPPSQTSRDTRPGIPTTTTRQLSSSRAPGYVPHTLLRTCRQIYYEARALPFEASEFVFDSWMTCVLAYCTASLRAMADWQRQSLRHVRFHVNVNYLGDARPELVVWLDICARMPAVRGLRLQLTCDSLPETWFRRPGRDEKEDDGNGVVVPRGPAVMRDDDWEGGRRWIVEGLGKMAALRQVEIEPCFLQACFLDSDFPADARDEMRARFCDKIGEILNEGRAEAERTTVVGVVKDEEKSKGWFGPCLAYGG